MTLNKDDVHTVIAIQAVLAGACAEVGISIAEPTDRPILQEMAEAILKAWEQGERDENMLELIAVAAGRRRVVQG